MLFLAVLLLLCMLPLLKILITAAFNNRLAKFSWQFNNKLSRPMWVSSSIPLNSLNIAVPECSRLAPFLSYPKYFFCVALTTILISADTYMLIIPSHSFPAQTFPLNFTDSHLQISTGPLCLEISPASQTHYHPKQLLLLWSSFIADILTIVWASPFFLHPISSQSANPLIIPNMSWLCYCSSSEQKLP